MALLYTVHMQLHFTVHFSLTCRDGLIRWFIDLQMSHYRSDFDFSQEVGATCSYVATYC